MISTFSMMIKRGLIHSASMTVALFSGLFLAGLQLAGAADVASASAPRSRPAAPAAPRPWR